MGTFGADFVIRNRNDDTRNLRLNGTVDTGASYTVIPARLLDELGVERDETLTFVIADGSKQDLDIGWVEMGLQGRTKNVYVVLATTAARYCSGRWPWRRSPWPPTQRMVA